MKVTLSTWQKFHFFHLARQMEKRGWLQEIFSTYPRFALRNEGIPQTKIHPFSLIETFVLGKNKFGFAAPEFDWRINRLKQIGFDRYMVSHMAPCDLFIGLSGSGLVAGRHVQAQGGAYVCERTSGHVTYVEQLLREEFAHWNVPYVPPPQVIIDRECEEYETADRLVVPSGFVKRTMVAKGIPGDHVIVNPLGVALEQFWADPQNDRVAGELNVVYVGGVSLRKGIPYLLDGFSRLKHPRKRLTLVGVIAPEITQVLERFPQQDVVFHGKAGRDEVRRLLNGADVLILPSVEDGFGLVITEAMACGCAVIASENTGGPDVIDDGVEGFIIPIRDPGAIADRLQRLADEPDLLASMGKAAQQRVRSVGGWDAYGDTYEHLARSLTSDRR